MTLSRVFRPVLPVVGGLLLCFGGVLLGGCDGTGSKRASLYERLTETGTWTVEELREEGGFNYTSQLNERYRGGVKIAFEGADSRQTYRITGIFSEDSTEVLAEGTVTLRDDVLRMASGFGRPVEWTYGFEASRAIFSLQFGSQPFLRALLSGGSQNEDLEMTLAPADE